MKSSILFRVALSFLLTAAITSAAFATEPVDANTQGMFRVILQTVYESELDELTASPNKYNFEDENVTVYTARCQNGRACDLIVTSDNRVYINENADTPNFKRVVVGNRIVIGEPVNDYSWVDFDAEVLGLAKQLFDDSAEVSQIDPDSEEAQVAVDHRLVKIYRVTGKSGKSGFIAIDGTAEYVYCAPEDLGEFYEAKREFRSDAYSLGRKVSVEGFGAE